MGVSIQALLVALKLRLVKGTLPTIPVWRVGADSLSKGVKVRVTAAALRLRTSTLMNDPSRPKASPLLLLGLISSGA